MPEGVIDMARYIDDDKILTCKTMREAINLCINTSGKQVKEIAAERRCRRRIIQSQGGHAP